MISAVGSPLARRFADRFGRAKEHRTLFVGSLILCLGLAALAEQVGLAALVGAFLAGMVLAVTEDRKITLPVCAWLNGEYGIDGVFLGVPAVLGRGAGSHSDFLRQRSTRSRAALGQSEKQNLKPASGRRCGITRRLFRINSVSVRRKKAPISNIHFVAGRPMRAPQA